MALVLLSLISYNYGKSIEKEKEIITKIEKVEVKTKLTKHQIDSIQSLVKRDKEIVTKYETKIVEIEKEYKEIEAPKDTVCLDLYNQYKKSNDNLKERLIYKDSIIIKKDSIIKYLDLIIVKQDTIIKYKDEQIELYKNLKPSKKGVIGYGAQVGATYMNGKLTPYIGGGLNINIDKLFKK